jgi:hypothetical protein
LELLNRGDCTFGDVVGAMGKKRAVNIGEYDFDFAAFLVHLFL